MPLMWLLKFYWKFKQMVLVFYMNLQQYKGLKLPQTVVLFLFLFCLVLENLALDFLGNIWDRIWDRIALKDWFYNQIHVLR